MQGTPSNHYHNNNNYNHFQLYRCARPQPVGYTPTRGNSKLAPPYPANGAPRTPVPALLRIGHHILHGITNYGGNLSPLSRFLHGHERDIRVEVLLYFIRVEIPQRGAETYCKLVRCRSPTARRPSPHYGGIWPCHPVPGGSAPHPSTRPTYARTSHYMASPTTEETSHPSLASFTSTTATSMSMYVYI